MSFTEFTSFLSLVVIDSISRICFCEMKWQSLNNFGQRAPSGKTRYSSRRMRNLKNVFIMETIFLTFQFPDDPLRANSEIKYPVLIGSSKPTDLIFIQIPVA